MKVFIRKFFASFIALEFILAQSLFAGNNPQPLDSNQKPIAIVAIESSSKLPNTATQANSSQNGEQPLSKIQAPQEQPLALRGREQAFNLVAQQFLKNGYDVNGDKKITLEDVNILNDAMKLAQKEAANVGAYHLPEAAQAVFLYPYQSTYSLGLQWAGVWTNPVADLEKYLKETDQQKKLYILQNMWIPLRDEQLNALWPKKPMIDFLVKETLDKSSDPALEAGVPLATLVSVLKRENQISTYSSNILNSIEKRLPKPRRATEEQLARMKQVADFLWNQYHYALYYSPKCFQFAGDAAQDALLKGHLAYLDQIVNTIKGKASPFIQNTLVSIQMNTDSGAGAGDGMVGSNQWMMIRSFIHETMHVAAEYLGWKEQGAPPEYAALFQEMKAEDFPTGYHPFSNEGFAELMTENTMDTEKFLEWAMQKFFSGARLLPLESFLILYNSVYPKDPTKLTTYKVNSNTGEVSLGSLPMKQDEKGRVIQILWKGTPYIFIYDSTNGRLAHVIKISSDGWVQYPDGTKQKYKNERLVLQKGTEPVGTNPYSYTMSFAYNAQGLTQITKTRTRLNGCVAPVNNPNACVYDKSFTFNFSAMTAKISDSKNKKRTVNFKQQAFTSAPPSGSSVLATWYTQYPSKGFSLATQ